MRRFVTQQWITKTRAYYASGTIRHVAAVISKSYNSPNYIVIITNLYMYKLRDLPEIAQLPMEAPVITPSAIGRKGLQPPVFLTWWDPSALVF